MRKKKEYRLRQSKWIEIEEYIDSRYGAKGQKRQKKRKATPEQVKKQNQLNKAKRARRMLMHNFEEDDYYFTLTFKKELRPDMEGAKKIWGKLQRQIRKEYKKQNRSFKWMINIERGRRGAIHFHLIMNRLEGGDKLIRRLWTFGGVYIRLLYEDGGYKALADYITKESEEGEESSYSHSRNLPVPEPKIKPIKGEWKDIKPYKGYYIDKESVVEGINPVTGYQYRHYTMVRINRRI